MKTNTTASQPGQAWRTAIALFVLVAGLMFGLVSGRAHAAPPAGTVIGNTATATYTDATLTSRTATSNPVQTTVSQVKSFTLTADGTRTASAGQTVYFPHTLTNTGNGTDTYTLNAIAVGGGFTHTTPAYYADADGNGVPDSLTPITGTVTLPAGPTGVFRFVVGGTVPGSATNGQTGTMTPSISDTQVTTTTNTDTTTVANSAITMTKALSLTSGGSPAGPITVTLAYTNTGSAVANTLTVTDTLDSRFTYVPGSGRWSVSGATALDDNAGGDPAGINYTITGGNLVTAVITSVPATSSGTLTFQVNVNSGVAPGNIPNFASYTTTTQGSANTNTATYQVIQVAGVVANGSPTDSESALDVNHVAIPQGGTAVFTNYVWNRGNAADSFEILLESNTFPPGTSLVLMQADGVTPLVANTTPVIPLYSGAACPAPFVTDATGPVTACGYPVVLRATVPPTGTSGPVSVVKRARSVFNNAVSEIVTDTLAGISANVVDLTNNTARSDSTPPGTATAGNNGFGTTGAAVITTNNVTPSTSGTTTTRFALYVNNVAGPTDTFTLGATGLPAGWTLTFRDSASGVCTTTGPSVGSAVLVNAGANRLVCAEITIPATTTGQATPGNHDIDFTATSQTSATVTDVKRDRVVLATVNSVTVAPPQTQQTYPNGSVTYQHTITNLGNVTENITFNGSMLTNTQAGWNALAYVDVAPLGVFDAADETPANQITPATTFSLAPNATRTVWLRVFAPGAVTPANVTTFNVRYATDTLSTSVADTTSITEGLLLLKEQATVTGPCTTVGTYSTAAIPAGPLTAPGQCIAYRITGTNVTAANITSVVINDNIPANTRQWNACGAPATTVGTVTSPGNNLTGTVSANVGTLTPSQAAIVTFCVRIDP